MKKMLLAILVTALASFGLVSVSSSPASAACPYTSCIDTVTTPKAKPAKVKKGNQATVNVKVQAESGNAKPQGFVKVTIKRKGGGFSYTQTQAYAGGKATFFTQDLNKKGKYKVTAKFIPTQDSVFNPSTGKTSFKVVKP